MLSRLAPTIMVACALTLTQGAGCTKKNAEPAASAHQGDHKHPEGAQSAKVSKLSPQAKVFFRNLKGGQRVEGPLKEGKVAVEVQMGASNVEIRPAGQQIDFTGHHHIVVDGAPVPLGTAVPADETHIHFGKGQTKASVPLTPGKHTLTLQLADGFHLSYGPKASAKIEIEVAAGGEPSPVSRR